MHRVTIATVVSLALIAGCDKNSPTTDTPAAAPKPTPAAAAPASGKPCPAGLAKLAPLPVCGKIPAELPVSPNQPNFGSGAIVKEWRLPGSHTNVRVWSQPYNSGMFYDKSKTEALTGNGGQLIEKGTFPDDGVWATFKYDHETRQAIFSVIHDKDVKVMCVAEKETTESAAPDAAGMFAICKTLALP